MCCDHSNETSFSVLFMVMFVSVLVFFVCLFVCFFFNNFDISSVIFSLLMSSSFSMKRGLRAKNKFGTVARHVDRPRKF